MKKGTRSLRDAVKQLAVVPIVAKVDPRIQETAASQIGGYVCGKGWVAALLPPEQVEALDDVDAVIKVYLNRVKGIPELPDYVHTLPTPTIAGQGILQKLRAFVEKKAAPVSYTDTMTSAKLIGADKAWSEGILGRVKVAVVDSDNGPITLSHPQIRYSAESYSVRTAFTGSTNGHATHVGTTVGGMMQEVQMRGSKATCIGIAPGSKLMFIKSLITPIGTGMDSDIIEGIHIALSRGARVINMSLGSPPRGPPEEDPLCQALSELPKNVIACVASGNDGSHQVGSPAYCPNVLAINALDPKTGEKAEFSQYGPESAFIMPGVDILSGVAAGSLLDIEGKGPPSYSVLSGTSMATPHASGMVALFIEYFDRLGKTLTVEDFRKIGEYYGEPKSDERGYGMLKWDYAKAYAKDLGLLS